MSDRWGLRIANNSSLKAEENRLRRVAARRGMTLRKSRRRDVRAVDYGKWYLSSDGGDVFVAGSLSEIDRYLSAVQAPERINWGHGSKPPVRMYFEAQLRSACRRYGFDDEQTDELVGLVKEEAATGEVGPS